MTDWHKSQWHLQNVNLPLAFHYFPMELSQHQSDWATLSFLTCVLALWRWSMEPPGPALLSSPLLPLSPPPLLPPILFLPLSVFSSLEYCSSMAFCHRQWGQTNGPSTCGCWIRFASRENSGCWVECVWVKACPEVHPHTFGDCSDPGESWVVLSWSSRLFINEKKDCIHDWNIGSRARAGS